HRLLVVQDRSGGVDLESEVAADVAVGDSVDVVGFPDGQPGFMSLSQALVRKGGTNALPSPVSISADDLYSGRGQARLVRISGELLGETMEDGNPVLEIRSKPWIFRAKLLKGPVRLSSMPIGSQLQVTGVPLAGRRFSGGNGGKAEVGSLEILLRTADDVVVQQWPPWWVWEHATIIIGALALVVVGAMLWIRYLRLKVARRTEELKVAMTELERQTKTSATLEERNRLAREIHDGLEQGLSAIMMQLDGLESQIGSDPADVARHLELARKMVRFSRTEVRHSLFDWKSPALVGRNLGDALAGIARQMSAGSEPRVTVQVTGKVIPLPAAIEHHLLRMAQEALNNALKYSRASLIQIELAYEDGRVRLAVRDDGRGFDAAAILNGSDGHFGLQNLRSRARKLGGAVEIESAPGKGTRIEATVPVSKPDTDTDLELM
ncbi:MAG TPA: sensor histidine kinase, partial [Verrucomicrobiae bacterium]|nr:sensor histidine kinase [Verrucomicrobiae bacterium]